MGDYGQWRKTVQQIEVADELSASAAQVWFLIRDKAVGKVHAMTADQISDSLGWKRDRHGERVRDHIRELSYAGFPVVSNVYGFWVTLDDEELKEYACSLRTRASQCEERANAVDAVLENLSLTDCGTSSGGGGQSQSAEAIRHMHSQTGLDGGSSVRRYLHRIGTHLLFTLKVCDLGFKKWEGAWVALEEDGRLKISPLEFPGSKHRKIIRNGRLSDFWLISVGTYMRKLGVQQSDNYVDCMYEEENGCLYVHLAQNKSPEQIEEKRADIPRDAAPESSDGHEPAKNTERGNVRARLNKSGQMYIKSSSAAVVQEYGLLPGTYLHYGLRVKGDTLSVDVHRVYWEGESFYCERTQTGCAKISSNDSGIYVSLGKGLRHLGALPKQSQDVEIIASDDRLSFETHVRIIPEIETVDGVASIENGRISFLDRYITALDGIGITSGRSVGFTVSSDGIAISPRKYGVGQSSITSVDRDDRAIDIRRVLCRLGLCVPQRKTHVGYSIVDGSVVIPRSALNALQHNEKG